jgi:hypothetical protein
MLQTVTVRYLITARSRGWTAKTPIGTRSLSRPNCGSADARDKRQQISQQQQGARGSYGRMG